MMDVEKQIEEVIDFVEDLIRESIDAYAVQASIAVRAPMRAKLRTLLSSAQSGEQEAVASIYISANGDREFDDWRVPLPVGSNHLYTHPATALEVPEDWMEHLGFILDAEADGVWLVIGDTGEQREANLTERVLWKELMAIRAAIAASQPNGEADANGAPKRGEVWWQLDVDNEPHAVFFNASLHGNLFDSKQLWRTREEAAKAGSEANGEVA